MVRRAVSCVIVMGLAYLSLGGGARGPEDQVPPPFHPPTWKEGTTAFRRITASDFEATLATSAQGKSTIVVKKPDGSVIFEGPFDSEDERAKVSPAVILAIRMVYIREQMNIPEEEVWKQLEPKIALIIDLQKQYQTDLASDPLGLRPTTTHDSPDAATNSLAGLRQAVNSNTPSREVEAAMTKFREQRDKLRKKLADARAQLRNMVTVRQEAVLLELGVLE